MTASYADRRDSSKVVLRRSAEKELRLVPKPDLRRIISRIRNLASVPRPRGCKKLKPETLYRVRQGQWRVVYEVLDAHKKIIIVKIGNRREVYRDL